MGILVTPDPAGQVPMATHDPSYKLLFSHRKMVSDLLRGFVYEEWAERLDFNTLEPVREVGISQNLRQRVDDVIWRLRIIEDGRARWLYVYIWKNAAIPRPISRVCPMLSPPCSAWRRPRRRRTSSESSPAWSSGWPGRRMRACAVPSWSGSSACYYRRACPASRYPISANYRSFTTCWPNASRRGPRSGRIRAGRRARLSCCADNSLAASAPAVMG